MKPITLAILLSVIYLFSSSSIAQSGPSKSLLWRISGNGLQKPSYLYGTMHLKDRRLFFFGDSVYKSLEASEGFAMEIDPNEMMDSLFSKGQEVDTSSLIRKILGKKKFQAIAKKLEKKFGMPADKISRKQLIDERENWYYHINKPDDMTAVVDLYLYDIAHKQGKWVGGIEDVNDQSGIKDELGKDINIAEYVNDDDDVTRKAYLAKMIALYTSENIDQLYEVIDGVQSQKSKDLILINRNVKMAMRMDSMAHVRNSFFAVGAAHLWGESGLIHLLRSKGFSVSSVLSSVKVAPEKYTYTAREIPWVKFIQEDSAYAVEMPGRASDLKVANDVIKLKAYADLVTSTFYMTTFSFLSLGETPEVATNRMIKAFISKGFEKPEEKKISNKGVNGREVIAMNGKFYYRIQIFVVANKVFLVMAGGEQKKILFTPDVERFLHSLVMNTALDAKPNNWSDFTDTTKAFSISFPKTPSVSKLNGAGTDPHFESTSYSSSDQTNSTYYVVGVSDTRRGFIITEDSLIFNSKLNYYKENQATITDTRKFDFEGNNAFSFSAGFRKDGLDLLAKVLLVCRGNRSYYLAAVTQKGKEDYPDISHFFRSFSLTPYPRRVWSNQQSPGKVFSTWAPGTFTANEPDTVGLTGDDLQNNLSAAAKLSQLIAHEPYSTTTYTVFGYPVSKYYAATSDSSFLQDLAAQYFSDTSSSFAKENTGRFDS
ncbi:MAG: TraB/GumN family protein, partial [Ferruginibacter sp.]